MAGSDELDGPTNVMCWVIGAVQFNNELYLTAGDLKFKTNLPLALKKVLRIFYSVNITICFNAPMRAQTGPHSS
jgi:hypothetical protein